MNDDYFRIERAVRYLQLRLTDQPSLDEVARYVGLSPYHFQRLFRRWVGISPKRYLGFLTVTRAKGLLRNSRTVLETAYDVGLTAPSRLHEQFVSVEGISPGEYKSRWKDMEIVFGIAPGPFGEMLIARTPRGVCMLSFLTAQTTAREIERLHRLYGRAVLTRDDAVVTDTAKRIFAGADTVTDRLHLSVRGTNFQIAVWRALLKIPPGMVTSYRHIAETLGRPHAARAVGNAIADNTINFLIPCHRVLRADGSIGGYRGGPELKAALLEWEATGAAADDERTVASARKACR